jgi:hypothetical protein
MVKHAAALIFDLNDILVPDSTSALSADGVVNVEDFCKKEIKALVHNGYDYACASRLHALIKDDIFNTF